MAKKAKSLTPDEKLLEEIKQRFSRCEDAEAENRNLWKEDLRFANGDPENGWQWEESMRKQREIDKRPCLTVNKVKQHNRQITNDARQNKPSVRVYPVDDGADTKTADILNGIIRHIEANSDADVAYDTGAEFAVDAGLGYWRITTDYVTDESFDQEIYIERVKNPLNVYLDPDIQKADGSDARFGFFFKDMEKAEFEKAYPDAEVAGWPMESAGGNDWIQKDKIRIAEYFRKVEVKDTLYALPDGSTRLASEMEKEELALLKEMDARSRSVKSCRVEWFLTAGAEQILERRDWPGIYIPIVRVVGDEMDIDGKVDRKGHTRQMKDAQRMYNYNSSASIEYGALQTKTPILAPADAISGYENYWNVANTQNLPYLPYNHLDENGQPVPNPVRLPPPTPATLFLQGMQTASEEMKMASGQYDASMGSRSNETSGRAILARQREGDTATFHFVDNMARAIKYTGKILLDLIPKIYDTARVIRILGEDGTEDMVQIDPEMQKAYEKRMNRLTQQVEEIYNPGVGRYDVVVAVGPSYSTKRQEAFMALNEMASRNPALLQQAGDLIMKAADFPMADELSDRLKKFLPPEAQEEDDDVPPAAKAQIQQLTQQVQQLDGLTQKMSAELENKEAEEAQKQLELNIKAYQAKTDRIKAVGAFLTPPELDALASDVREEALEQPEPLQPPDMTPEMMEPQHMHPEFAPPMQMEQPEQPPSGGFFTPEQP